MNLAPYTDLLATDISDAQGAGHAMDIGIKSLLSPTSAIMGFAFTVRCTERSNTFMHDAIYSAPKGSIIVAEVDENNYAVAGGNVCAVAQQNGIAGFVIDGAIRDLGELRSLNFPVFARGVFPKPGGKGKSGESQVTINCGGVAVSTGDLIVADEEGIVVIPQKEIEETLATALEKQQKAAAKPLADWRANHEKMISDIVNG